MTKALPQMLNYDETYCKVTEALLKICYKLLKPNRNIINEGFVEILMNFKNKTASNPAINSLLIKTLTLAMTH